MATCSPTELLADAKCFMCLSEKQLDLAMLQLLREWASDTSTPSELVTAAKCITCLDTKQIELMQTQLLCDIAGGT